MVVWNALGLIQCLFLRYVQLLFGDFHLDPDAGPGRFGENPLILLYPRHGDE
jgi:hypothetical protein